MIQIDVADEQSGVPVAPEAVEEIVRLILQGEGIDEGEVSVAVVDDPTIHELNRQYLKHDYPTDVLAFLLDRRGARLEGEIVVSADTARAAAERLGHEAGEELSLYLAHGTLHLLGYDDRTAPQRDEMRRMERKYLAMAGITPRFEPSEADSQAAASDPRPPATDS